MRAGGEGGIRTHGRGNPDTRSPGVPVRPLQHLSAERVGFEPTLRINRRPLFESGTINHSVTSPEADSQDTALHNAVLVSNSPIMALRNTMFNRVIILWRYQFIKGFRSSFLRAGCYMAMRIESHLYGSMSRPLLDYFGNSASLCAGRFWLISLINPG